MNKIVKDALVLFAITLAAGIILGGVYSITKQPIEAQNEKAKQEAYKAVMGNADSFEKVDNSDSYIGNIKSDAQDFSADSVTDVVAGVKDNKIVGFVVTVVASDGYGGDIKFSIGVDKDGKYTGTSILSISETAGLGMRVKTDPSFLSQFEGKTADTFTLVKDGSGSSADDKIDAIGGSTVTSKAVTKGIDAGLTVVGQLMSDNVKTVGGAGIE